MADGGNPQAGWIELAEALGYTGSAAQAFIDGRDPVPFGPGFDGFVESFRRMGMSEADARAAGIGRDGTEDAARRAFTEATPGGLVLDDVQRRTVATAVDQTAAVEAATLRTDPAETRRHVVALVERQLNRTDIPAAERVSHAVEFLTDYRAALVVREARR